MTDKETENLDVLSSLRERAKELNCLYRVEEVLMNDQPLKEKLQTVAEVMTSGWLKPDLCEVSIRYRGQSYQSAGYHEGGAELSEKLTVQGIDVGEVFVSYPESTPAQGNDPFLPDEKRLIKTLSQRISQSILHEKLTSVFQSVEAESPSRQLGIARWRSILDMLSITNRKLYTTLCRRMLNYLNYIGVDKAESLLEKWVGQASVSLTELEHIGINQPSRKHTIDISGRFAEEILSIASTALSDDQIFQLLQKWIGENRIDFLIDVLDDHSSSLHDICQAVERYKDTGTDTSGLSLSALNAVKVALIRRFISRRLEFISVAKEYVTLDDFYTLSKYLIFPSGSHGQLGGKSAGLFMARYILRDAAADDKALKCIHIPKTWYITSDGILDFVHYNHLEELLEYRYRNISEIRMEYPNLVQLFKNSAFSPEMIQGISMALDDFDGKPLIVRSSSLLEDSIEAAFSGKHKSLFIANQGSKQERVEALLDAIAEVYASMFGPDPIEYRAERGLLDFQEEMGILIQEVVGTKLGPYFLPAFSGVAFSRNEFRWSSRIKRDDGLLRLVPGLGTRAVDRLSDDYPVLIAPGQPGLRVNASTDETIRYAPKFMDLINLETRSVETVRVDNVIEEYGAQYPQLEKVFSVYDDGMLRVASTLTNFKKDYAIPIFEGLAGADSGFIPMMYKVLKLLENKCGYPVDIEFAADGENLYLLQCRAQSSWGSTESVRLPENPDPDDLIFTAERFVSDGYIPSISHAVYISPEAYANLADLQTLKEVGRTVGRLNTILPKRRFVLMGPGRWGSRGDIKLGVNVTYSDINNTAALIEMAFRKGNYVPDLSFGTHFFQDLVEASIRYLPLYPDDDGIVFNRPFFENSENILSQLLPDAAYLSDVVRVLDIPRLTGNRELRIVMSGDEGKAVAFLVESTEIENIEDRELPRRSIRKHSDEHWLWRQRIAEKLAVSIDPARYGVKAMYLFGSTMHATAGPCSDIDLLVHFSGTSEQLLELESYLKGWSISLGEVNYIRTGFETGALLDTHIITDEDIANKTSYAVKIGSISDPARPLALGPV